MNIMFSGIIKLKGLPFGKRELFGYQTDTWVDRSILVSALADTKLKLRHSGYRVVENEPDVFILNGDHINLPREELLNGLASGTLKTDQIITFRTLGAMSIMGGGGAPSDERGPKKPVRKTFWQWLFGK